MENLVAIEVEKQLKSFPQKRIENISKLDVITYALNRLPPLYAASKEGMAKQTEEGKENYQEKIKLTVQLAIAQVRRDPIRKATRITSPSYLGKMSVEGSDGV
ncbi:late competence development ComFB family protein [Dactylococcopsis salina]|nr:late competence development ComFB family protein [Dactylococcopsis salina]